jgi:NAD-dependent SIR2 family protein deacetylase
VLTGAGCSTASGIPDYRDENGGWKHQRPMQFAEFAGSATARRRYWARSVVGWRRIEGAMPNPAHLALARLEALGRIRAVLTQNVDDLHRRAGSRNVIDLHGVLSRVRCLGCGTIVPRADLQDRIEAMNPDWRRAPPDYMPDGDARLADAAIGEFRVPGCAGCGGVLKPDVVFFGESVPRERVQRAMAEVLGCDALLVVGSSLMVLSGFRFARIARAAGLPLAILNRGITRADAIATDRFTGDCACLLPSVADHIAF